MPVKWEGVEKLISGIERVATQAKSYQTDVVTTIAEQSKAIVLATATTDVPGLSMSRFARGRPLKLNAKVIVAPGGSSGASEAAVFPTPPAPWYLLNEGSYKHSGGWPIGIRVRGGGARRGTRNNPGFLGSTATGFAAMGPVQHPAVGAKHTWEKGVTAAQAKAVALWRGAIRVKNYEMFRSI